MSALQRSRTLWSAHTSDRKNHGQISIRMEFSPFASRVQEFSNVFPFVSEFLGVSAFRAIPRVSRSWNRHLGPVLKTQIGTRRLQNGCELRAKNAFERKLPYEFKSGGGSPYSNRCIIYHVEMDRLVLAEDILPGDWVVIRERSGNQWTATADLTRKGDLVDSRSCVHRFFYLGFHVNEKDTLQSEAECLTVTRIWTPSVKKKRWAYVRIDEQYVDYRPHFHRSWRWISFLTLPKGSRA